MDGHIGFDVDDDWRICKQYMYVDHFYHSDVVSM